MTDPKPLMTLSEVAEYLKLAEKTVLRMAHKGQIPCAKVGSQWRFIRSVIDEWLLSQMKAAHRSDLSHLIESAPDVVPLSRLIREDLVNLDVQPGPKREVLRQLVHPLIEAGIVHQGEPYLVKLLEREKMVSTALGRGVAIPHLRNPRECPAGPVMAVGLCRQGTDFQAPDRGPTHLFFLLVTDSEIVHLRLLAKLNRILRHEDLLPRLLRAGSRQELVGLLIQADQVKSLLSKDHS